MFLHRLHGTEDTAQKMTPVSPRHCSLTNNRQPGSELYCVFLHFRFTNHRKRVVLLTGEKPNLCKHERPPSVGGCIFDYITCTFIIHLITCLVKSAWVRLCIGGRRTPSNLGFIQDACHQQLPIIISHPPALSQRGPCQNTMVKWYVDWLQLTWYQKIVDIVTRWHRVWIRHSCTSSLIKLATSHVFTNITTYIFTMRAL